MSPPRFATLALFALASPAFPGEPAPPPREVRFDLAGDPLPPGAVARLGTTRFRVRGWHQQVFLTADGNTAIAKSEESVLKAFDVATGKLAWDIKDADVWNWHADQSPDGRYLAVFGLDRRGQPRPDTTLRLYDLATRQALWESVIREPGGDHHRVRFTPDGKRLVTAAQDVRVWDAATGDELIRQKIPFGYGSLDVSPDGKTIAVGYYQLYLWDWESGAEPRKVTPDMRCDGLRFAPDGRTVFTLGMGGTSKAVDVATAKPVGRGLDTGKGAVQWVRFSPDGARYAVGYHRSFRGDGAVSVRDAATGAEVARLPTGTEGADDGCWSRDGSRLAAVTDYRVWVWDPKTHKPFGPDGPAHGAMITALAFAPDGRLFSAADDHTVRAWDPATGKERMRLTMDGWVRGLAVSPDGTLVAGNGLRNDFRVWDAKTGKDLFKLTGHGDMGGLRQVRFSADEQTLLSWGDDCYLRVFNALTGKLKAEHRLLPPGLRGDPEDDVMERQLMLRDGAVVLGPDGTTFVRAAGKDVSVIDAITGKERFRLAADPQRVEKLAISPDGKRLATVGPGVEPAKPKPGEMLGQPQNCQLTVWDLTKAEPVARARISWSRFVSLLAFTPDSQRLVVGSGQNVLHFYDPRSGTATGTVELPERPGTVAFDAGMKRLAVAFWDTTAVVYDLAAVMKPAKGE